MGRLWIAVSILLPTAVGAIVPVTGQLPLPMPTTINAGPGNQQDPHVSAGFVVYTADAGALLQVRYYDLATGIDTAIPNQLPDGTFVRDFLPDVDSTRIVFTRVWPNTSIQLFDAATNGPPVELDPQPGSERIAAVIGGDTVAWIDFGAGAGGEIVAFDLGTQAATQLTANAPVLDRRLAVSPDGDVIVWEQCALNASPCDIYKAVRMPEGWSVDDVTATPDGESFADTNGTIAVYGATRANAVGGPDIFWTDLATGIESQLEIDGTEIRPSLSGSFVAFEHFAPSGLYADLFLYDIATNTLYQVTDTPNESEVLNDVHVGDGTVRTVWAVLEGSDLNVYSLAFQLAQPIFGQKLVVKDPNGSETRRSVIGVGKEQPASFASLGGDPTITGATLRVFANGATSSNQSFTLDASGWTETATGYKYRGPTTGDPVKRVLLKRSSGGTAIVKVILDGGTGSTSLDVVPPNPGNDGGFVLAIPGGDAYCVLFGGAAGGTEVVDDPTQWKVINPVAAPGCPAVPPAP